MELPFHDKKFVLLLIASVLVVILEVLSLMGVGIPMPYAPFIFGLFILAIGWNVLWDGCKALFTLNFSSISLLMLIAVCAAFYLGEYPEAAVVIVLYVLGEKLEDIGIENSKAALESLADKAPKTANVLLSGELIPVESIPVGTIISIKPHDQIPMDGVIISGETSVDESAITGEPLAKERFKGDSVFAGTMNKNGYIEVQTTRLAQDTTYAKILELTFEAQENKSESEKFIQKFARYYTPSIIIAAVLLLLVPVYLLGGDFNHWLLQAISLLVISCPCALVISTPVAVYAALGNASGKGILVKGGHFLEDMARVGIICLDKTRTITYGNPVVSDIFPVNGTSKEELLACAAGTELFSEHPLAQAIVDASRKEGLEPHRVEKFMSVAGKGAVAQCLACNDEKVIVGNLSFIREHHEVEDEVDKIVKRLSSEGKTSVVVSFNDQAGGVIALTDEIKPDSAEAIREIRMLGLKPVMLTGDNKIAAAQVAAQVGIEEVRGGLLPEDKSACIKELQLQSPVAMVGDGINDAPALALAHVSIAMGAAGSDAAMEVANIALMNDRLSLIPFLVRLSREMVRKIKLNTFLAILIKLVFILLAILGYTNLVMAITADVGVALLVILLSLRLMKFK